METLMMVLILLIIQISVLWVKRKQEFEDLNLWFIDVEIIVGVLIGVVRLLVH